MPASTRWRGFVVHSPRQISVEGGITYTRDPRSDSDSGDFLGLVSDRDIEVAPPNVTGPGDLNIQAALFVRRHMVVADSGHRDSATLNIYGDLAAGTLSGSEPRFARGSSKTPASSTCSRRASRRPAALLPRTGTGSGSRSPSGPGPPGSDQQRR